MAKDSQTTSKTVLPEDFIIKVNPHLNSKGKWNGVNVFDKEHKDAHNNKEIKKTYADNVINVTFGKSDKC